MIDDWGCLLLSSIEAGGEYLKLMPKVIELLDAIKTKETTTKGFDEACISSFLKTTIPTSINKFLNFGEIQNQKEIDSLTNFFAKIVETLPNIQSYINSELVDSFSKLFDSNSKLYQQNKPNLFYPKILNSLMNSQDEIINTLKSINAEENINCCYYNYLISSIHYKAKQSKRRIKGLNNYTNAILNNFHDFITTNINYFHFFSNKKIIQIVSKTFDLILDFFDKKSIEKLFIFLEDKLIIQNIEIQKFIGNCISKLYQKPKYTSVIYSIEVESQKMLNYLLTHTFNPKVLNELKPFLYFLFDHEMMDLNHLIEFWKFSAKSDYFEKEVIYVDLIVYSLKYLEQDSINEFLSFVQNEYFSYFFKFLSKVTIDFQNNEITEKISVSCIKLLLNFAKTDECAYDELINLINNSITDLLSECLISEILPLIENHETINLACSILNSIINNSSDPFNLIDTNYIFNLLNEDNEDQIVHILIQYCLKTKTKLNNQLIEILKKKQNINDDIWIQLKMILVNNTYQNNREINKLYDIAKKQNLQNVSLDFFKFLKVLVFKLSNRFFIEPKRNVPIHDFHCSFRIIKNTIEGLDLVLNVYLSNNNPRIILSSKKFLLKIFEGWNCNYTINFLNSHLNTLLKKEKCTEELSKFLQLILDLLQKEMVDPEDFNHPRHFYPKNFLKLTIIIKNYSTTKIQYSIHFNQGKTLQNLKERISLIEDKNINSIKFENFSSSQITKTMDECGITNNSEIVININSIEKSQGKNEYQKPPSIYFSQINIQDILMSMLNKNELNINSITWEILQLLPTSQSIMNMINYQSNDPEIIQKFNSLIIDADNNYKKLYLIQAFSKKNNIFNFPNVITIIIELFQEDYLKEPIIYLLNSFYKNEKFQQCKNIALILIDFLGQAKDDEIIIILKLLSKMSIRNDFDFILSNIDKFENINHKYFNIVVELFSNIIEDSKENNEIFIYVKSKIENNFENSKLSLKIISKMFKIFDESNLSSIYSEIIKILQSYIDIFNEQKSTSQLLMISEILECLSRIIEQHQALTNETNFPINFFMNTLFDQRFKEMQRFILKIISVYIQNVKNQEITNEIILQMNEIIKNSENSWNYDPFSNIKNESYTGLTNLGATCYINSVFQQLYHLFPVRYLLSKNKCKKQGNLKIIQKMIIQMHYTKRPIINTSEFVSKWKGWKNENVNPKEQQDSVEFFNYLLDSFPKKAKDLFKGEIINYINDDVSKNEQFYYLSIPVKGHNDIYSSFDEYIYKNDNEIISSQISKLPSILVVQLNRFEYINKFNTLNKINDKFEFPIELNIERICTNECKQNQDQFIYNLNGIIIHNGTANNGHYVSLIRKEDYWLCFNDEKVTKMSSEDAFYLSTGQKEIGSSAYALFYTQLCDDLKIYKQNKISFNEEFDFTNEVNNYNLLSIYKDNEIYEKNQMLYDKYVIEFIQKIEDPLLNISFFIKILCHSTNYQQSETFLSNLKKIISEEFNSIDSSSSLLECADYLIDNIEDIYNCYLYCANSFLLSNLTKFILFFFNYLDKIMIDDYDDNSYQSHEKSIAFFNKFGDKIIKPTNSIDKTLEMINLNVSYISQHLEEALKNGWTERLLKFIDNIYGLEISSKLLDFSNLNVTNILNTLNSLFIKSCSVDSNIICNLIKYGTKIKSTKENEDSYEKMILENIIPAIDLINENEEYLELENISSSDYLMLIKSFNVFYNVKKISKYSLLVFPKQKELLIFVAKHYSDFCKILLKAKVSLFKKSFIESNDEQTFINEINMQNDESYIYNVTIPEIGEILIAQNGDVLLNSLSPSHSILIKTPDTVIINSCNMKRLYIDSKNVIITNEEEKITKIKSLNINTAKLIISKDNTLEVRNIHIENVLIINYGLFLIHNFICNCCSILNNGQITTNSLKNIKFLLNTNLGKIEFDDHLSINAVNLYNYGVINSQSLTIIADSAFINNNTIKTSSILNVYSENIENSGKFEVDKAFFTGDNFRQYRNGSINAITSRFNCNKTECEGKLQISHFIFYNDDNCIQNKVMIFNNAVFSDIKKINISKCNEVLIGEKSKIKNIGNIINNGELIIKAQIPSIENIGNESFGKLFIMNNINVKSILYNKGHIVVLGSKNYNEGGSLYAGYRSEKIQYTLDIQGKFNGFDNSTLEIANGGVIFTYLFNSQGLTFCHRYLNIYECPVTTFSNSKNMFFRKKEIIFHKYGSVVSQDGITFNSYSVKLNLNSNFIQPSVEGNEKICKIISENIIKIDNNFNRNLNLIFETSLFINNSNLVAKSITVKTDEFINYGQISSFDNINIQCKKLINDSGRIESHKDILINAENSLENKGGGKLEKNVTENIKYFDIVKSDIHVDKKTGAYTDIKLEEKIKKITKSIYSPQLDKSGVITTDNGKLKIYSKSINNSFGIMNSKKGIELNGKDIIINECGLMHSGNDIVIKSKQFKNGYRPGYQTISSYDPNKPKYTSKKVIVKTKRGFLGRENKISFKKLPYDINLSPGFYVYFYNKNHDRKRLDLVDKIIGYEKYDHIIESSKYPGYLFAQCNIYIFSETDIYLGTIVSGKNISIQGKTISSFNIKDQGTIIANGDVNLEMNRASLNQAKIQAENIAVKILESITIEGIIQPVVIPDGSVIFILDLKRFAEIIGIFSKNPNITQKFLDYSEVSLKNTNSTGFIGEHPNTDKFISSLPDEQMRDVLNFLLTPIHGRNILQNPNLIQSLEYSGAVADHLKVSLNDKKKELSKIEKPVILYKKNDDDEVIINEEGEKQYVTVYNPNLIFSTLSKLASFLDAQKKLSIESMKNIKINPINIEVNSDLSLKAGEKVSLMSKYIYNKDGEKISVDRVNIKCANELTISGNEGVETSAVNINSKKLNIISSNGDIVDKAMSVGYMIENTGKLKETFYREETSDIKSQDSVLMKGKNIELTGTNITAGPEGIQFLAKENIDLNPTYEQIYYKYKSGRTKANGNVKKVVQQNIATNGCIDFNAKNINLISPKIIASLIRNNTNGNFNISAAYDHEYHYSFYKKKRLFGSCSREQKVIIDKVRPAEIVAKEIQSLGVGTLKIESAIINGINMLITKDLIENTLEDKYYSLDVRKRRGFFAPKINHDPLKESISAFKKLSGGDKFPSAIKMASSIFLTCSHIKTLTNLAALPNPTLEIASMLLSRFTTISLYSNLKQTVESRQKTPVQSQVNLGLFIVKNNKTHLEGIWNIDKASIETDILTTEAPKETFESKSTIKGWSIDFCPAKILTNSVVPCVLVPKICTLLPTLNITKGKSFSKGERNFPMALKASEIIIRCNDAAFSGAQIQSKLIDAIVEGKLTIESLTNLFESKSKQSNISIGLGSLFNSVNETVASSIYGKLQKIPAIRIANRSVLTKKIDALATLIGTERFYLKVGELFYTVPSLFGLVSDGSFVESGDEKIICGKKSSKKIEEVHKEKSRIINPSINEMIELMGQMDNYKSIHSCVINNAMDEGLNSSDISKVNNEISTFLNNEDNKKCYQEINQSIKKLKESVNEIKNIHYNYSVPEKMPEGISYKYHSKSEKIEKQIHDTLNYGTNLFQNYEQFLNDHSEMKNVYQNAMSNISNDIIDGLVNVPIIFCKDSLSKYQNKYSSIYQSKATKNALIEEMPDKIVDFAISHANNDDEGKDFANTIMFSLDNMTRNSNSFGIKNCEVFNDKLKVIRENIQVNCINREKMRNESCQAMSEFLDNRILDKIKFFPIDSL